MTKKARTPEQKAARLEARRQRRSGSKTPLPPKETAGKLSGDIRYFDLASTSYDVLPKMDKANVPLMNEWEHEICLYKYLLDNPGELAIKVIGYRTSPKPQAYFNENGEYNFIADSRLYLYTDDGRIFWSQGLTLIRNFFNIIRLLGIPSAQEYGKCFNLRIKLIKEHTRTRFNVQLDLPEELRHKKK